MQKIDHIERNRCCGSYDPPLCGSASAAPQETAATGRTRPPNILLIIADDVGFDVTTDMYPGLIDDLAITRKGRGKGTAFESGARVSMVIRGPRIEAATRSNDFVHVADLFSTTLALAGLKAPEKVSNRDGKGLLPVDGVSLAPILFDKAAGVRDPNQGYILTESLNLMTNSVRQVGARNATHKVVCTEKVATNSCEFFNLANDPLEEYPLPKGSAPFNQQGRS